MAAKSTSARFGPVVSVVALVLLVTGALAAPAAATPGAAADLADPAATQLTINGPASGELTGTVPLTATLAAEGAPVTGAVVRFERQSGEGWQPLGTGSTDGTGTASYDATVTGSDNVFRAVYDGDDAHLAAQSGTLSVTGVKAVTALTLKGPAKVTDEKSIDLVLTWVTVNQPRPVVGAVSVYRRVRHGKWTLNRHLSTTGDGTARFTVRPRGDTWWKAVGATGESYVGDATTAHYVDNLPPGRVVSYPKRAPKPSSTTAQARATGAGANVKVTRIPTSTWNQMTGISWHRGCPVGRAGLRLVTLNYWGFDGYRHRGVLVVNAHATAEFRSVFQDLYAARVPVRRMFRVDRFGYSKKSHGGNDFKAMRYDNTSAFNCRWVTGSPGVTSPHSYGYALDINTWENPYHSRVGWLPNTWWPHRSRGNIAWRSGKNTVVKIFRRNGFSWTYGTEDSQHFDVVNRGSRMLPDGDCTAFCD